MPVYTNALAPRPSNSLAYPGGIGKRGGSLDSFVPLDYSRLAAGQFRQDTPQMREYAANVPLDVLRGRFAGMLGFPSDVLNMFRTPLPMEMFGQTDYEQPTQVPYGTEQLLKTLPLAPAADNPLGQVANRVGSFVPITPMEALQAARVARQTAMATGRFVAPKAGQLAEQYMVRTGGILPLDVYHGTPHTLPPTPRNPLGEFDASKIGTGEGAQAYGHGLYFAENPAVAKEYQVKLSNANSAKNLADKFGGVDQGIAEAQRRIDHYTQLIANGGGGMPERAEGFLRISQKNLRDLQNIKAGLPENKGSLYKVDLPDEKIAKMLDWDKPMTEQEMIAIYDKMQQSPLASFAKPFQDNFYERMNRGQITTDGQDLFMELSKQLGGQKQVSDYLKSIDIPGIKYLDAGSRNASGTRNFVVFPGEEKSMTILERNSKTR